MLSHMCYVSTETHSQTIISTGIFATKPTYIHHCSQRALIAVASPAARHPSPTHRLHLAAPEVGVLDGGGQRSDAELAGQPDVAAVLGRLLQHPVSVDDDARDETLEVVGAHHVAAADRHQRRRVEHVVLVTWCESGEVRRGQGHSGWKGRRVLSLT